MGKVGRPRKDENGLVKMVCAKVSESDMKSLKKIASMNDLTVSDLVRRLITDEIETYRRHNDI